MKPLNLGLAVLLMVGVSSSTPGIPQAVWANLHPEFVKKYGYKVEEVDLLSGRSRTRQFQCAVWATWADGRYELALSYRDKRGQAVKDCEEWMDKAEKAIRRAQGAK